MPSPEAQAREKIDELLVAAGWAVQDYKKLNLGAARGIALREVPLASGPCDYLLLVDRVPLGVIEAKKAGTTLSGVAEQSSGYAAGLPDFLSGLIPGTPTLPFRYESTGIETLFLDAREPDCRSRRVFAFHQPETLAHWLANPPPLRARLKVFPPLATGGMRACQIEAITNLESSFARCDPRALIQMATGAGKTYTACAFIYRLIKHAGAKRILFLVDRANLGRQAKTEFDQFVTPDTGRKFTELYNVQHLSSNQLDDVSRVTICTIQRLYSMLRGEELDEDLEEKSTYELSTADARPKEVAYNRAVPIEAFDFIVTDECHRSIYNLWRQVLEYFDAFLIGLTATPSKQTIGFFNQNLVTEYNHERAVADGVNVGYSVYRIRTDVTERGGKVDKGLYVDKRHRETRAIRWQRLDEDFVYDGKDLDRSVVVKSQIRTVLTAFKDSLPELFPGRTLVPKTLIFAKDDSHAEDIVHLVREVFGKGNDFAKKITYKTYNPETKRYEKSETSHEAELTIANVCHTVLDSEKSMREICAAYRISGANLRNICEGVSWMVDVMASIASVLRPEIRMQFQELSACLIQRAPYSCRLLGDLPNYVSRDERIKLRARGIERTEQFLDLAPSELSGTMSPSKADRAMRTLNENRERSSAYWLRDHKRRLDALGFRTELIDKVYLAKDKELEVAVTDLFNTGFARLTAERIKEQRNGEPDQILLFPAGTKLSVQITAKESNAKFVDSKKAGDVISQSARFHVDGFICIGRPDFESLAKEQAGHLGQKYNYKQLPISVLAELYVRVSERRISAQQAEAFIFEQRGYLSLAQLPSISP